MEHLLIMQSSAEVMEENKTFTYLKTYLKPTLVRTLNMPTSNICWGCALLCSLI